MVGGSGDPDFRALSVGGGEPHPRHCCSPRTATRASHMLRSGDGGASGLRSTASPPGRASPRTPPVFAPMPRRSVLRSDDDGVTFARRGRWRGGGDELRALKPTAGARRRCLRVVPHRGLFRAPTEALGPFALPQRSLGDLRASGRASLRTWGRSYSVRGAFRQLQALGSLLPLGNLLLTPGARGEREDLGGLRRAVYRGPASSQQPTAVESGLESFARWSCATRHRPRCWRSGVPPVRRLECERVPAVAHGAPPKPSLGFSCAARHRHVRDLGSTRPPPSGGRGVRLAGGARRPSTSRGAVRPAGDRRDRGSGSCSRGGNGCRRARRGVTGRQLSPLFGLRPAR